MAIIRPRYGRVIAAVFLTSVLSWPALAADDATTAEGKQLFAQTCQVCHQADAIGKPGFAPSLTNKEFLSISSDKFIEATIRDGRIGTGMPPFGFLGPAKARNRACRWHRPDDRPGRYGLKGMDAYASI